jgi:hypothetical protein
MILLAYCQANFGLLLNCSWHSNTGKLDIQCLNPMHPGEFNVHIISYQREPTVTDAQ